MLYPNFIYSYALCNFELQNENVSLEDYRSFVGLVDTKQIQKVFDWEWDFNNSDINFYMIFALVLYPPLFKKIIKQADI